MGGKPSLLATDPRARPAGTGRHSPTPMRSVSKPTSDHGQDYRGLPRGEVADEIDHLRAELRHHGYLYHVEARPQLRDEEYDRLFGRLKALEEVHPYLITTDSPTQRVGAEPQGQLESLPHSAPMLSLDSTQDEAGVRRFDERVRRVVDGPVTYLLEPKLDGASIELVYERGILSRAVTRGNGTWGEGVTENVKTIPSVPLRLREAVRPAPELLAVRGEVMMYISEFEAFNERLVAKGKEPYASPRNSAAGAIRQLDPRITAQRRFEFLAYDVLAVRGVTFRRDREGVDALRQWGFRVPDDMSVVESLEDALDFHRRWAQVRDELNYEIDGIVIKLNELDARADLGTTSHHPRWALAYKFEPRQEVTRVERIGVSVGRTGVLTPIALLLPVKVGGVTIARASLHNREGVRRKDVREGDLVRIQRAGDVIPQVVERVVESGCKRGDQFVMPAACPACGTPVEERGPFTACPNRFGCSAQLKGRVCHFGSRNGLDIAGLGEETAQLLVQQGLVRELADLFDLEPAALLKLPGFAAKSAANLVAGIHRRREPELERFLYALGIPEVGVTVARDLALHFRGLEAMRSATQEELDAVPGVGPVMSETIHGFFESDQNRLAIDAILGRGVAPIAPKGIGGTSAPLAGRKFVFTGGLTGLSRARAKELVEKAGARIVSAVSKETDYVVVGDDPGSKQETAMELGVTTLDEVEFVALLEEAGLEVGTA
jgi:DNA ligase (NAD+)